MRRHLNTLYVTTDGAYLAKQGESVCVKVGDEIKLRIPFLNLEGVVCFGNVGCSPFLLGACAESGISVSFLSQNGQFLAAVLGYSPGNVLLRRTQYRVADTPGDHVGIVRNIVAAKIANCRSVLLRGARDSTYPLAVENLTKTARVLAPSLEKAAATDDVSVLRGIEGIAARNYFEGFNALLRADRGFRLCGRSRRPPLDPVNALLSFVYTILCHDVRAACESVGLDAAVGFLHTDRSGRPGLALDLMEEFRPYLADRLVISLINRAQISTDDFVKEEAGAWRMTDDARKRVLISYQKRKEDEILHPFIKEKVTIGILPLLQARLLARHLRGDLDEYPAFFWK